VQVNVEPALLQGHAHAHQEELGAGCGDLGAHVIVSAGRNVAVAGTDNPQPGVAHLQDLPGPLHHCRR
jgi:hypothetical protein